MFALVSHQHENQEIVLQIQLINNIVHIFIHKIEKKRALQSKTTGLGLYC